MTSEYEGGYVACGGNRGCGCVRLGWGEEKWARRGKRKDGRGGGEEKE